MRKTESTSKAIAIECIMFLTYAFFAVNWIAGSTLTNDIMKYFNLTSFASATLISNAITIAKIIGNFMAASILVKLLPKKAIALGSLLIVLGSVIAIFSPTYSIFIAGRFIMGFGGALYIVYFSPMVIHYFDGSRKSTVNAINGVAYNFGSIVAMIVVGPVVAWLVDWQRSMGFFCIISAILFIMWLLVGEDFPINKASNSKESQESKYSIGDALKEKFNWLLPLTYSGLLTLYIVMLTLFPLSGISVIEGKQLSTLVAVGGIIGSLIAIALAKVYHKRLPVIRYSGLLMTALGALLFYTNQPFLAIIAAIGLGTLMFLPVTSLMLIPQELPNMTPSKLTTIMGLFWAIAYIVETVAYFIIGIIIDKSGYLVALNFTLVLSLTFFIGSFLLPETGKKKSADTK